MTDKQPTPSLSTEAPSETVEESTGVTEALVEEVSIDGMCGVY